jgi:membrane-associated phospholipid phosphatase
MDTAPARTAHADAANALAADVRTSRRRRRPTGAPPPLPRTFPISSAGWLLATLALVAVFTITFAASRHSAALAITAADDRVVQWFAGLRSPWLTRVIREAALAGSWGATRALVWGTFVSLLVFKRFRHLIVYFVVINVTFYLVAMLSAGLKRPRPFGVAILGTWNGYALPSIQITLLAASLVTVLYTQVPEGRWRQTGKWAAAAIVAIAAVARIYLGADAPTDVLLGAALGVTIPLLAFRFITPNSVFPIPPRPSGNW